MSLSNIRLAKGLYDALTEKDTRKPRAYDTQAEVSRVEGNTIWVKFPGSEIETPVRKTINAKRGDTVQVRVANRRGWLVGNDSAPPTDDARAIIADQTANIADVKAGTANTTANTAKGTATAAKHTAESILVYDHTYKLSEDETTGEPIAIFTAYLYKGGIDVKESYPETLFTWYLKTEENMLAGGQYLGYGYTIEVPISGLDYGAEIIGYFDELTDSELLDTDGSNLTDDDGSSYSARSTGDTVRVRDLTKTSVIYPTDEIMLVTASEEKLATIETLADELWNKYAVTIEEQPLQQGNNNYEDIGLLRITNSEMEAIFTL